MDEAQIEGLFARIEDMTEADRLHLDCICRGLTEYMEKTVTDRGYTVPNRIVALACADVLMQWEQLMWERT